jgi:L-alanine-DL-glutamate epimerase-like enolase superfamily enzyme
MSTINFTLGRHEVYLREPFVTALRRVENYTVVTYTISDESGVSGVGEAVATPAIIGDSLDEIDRDFKERITPALASIGNLEEGLTILAGLHAASSSKAAADIALHSFFAAKGGLSLSALLGSKVERVKTDVTIPISTIEQLDKIVQDRVDQGFTSLKVKLGAISLSENIAIMQKIRELVGPQVSLRVDPNQAWDFAYAKDFLIALEKLEIAIDYLEQPVGKSQIDDLARLTALGLAPIMADESLFSMSDLEEIIEKKACTWVNVKILKSGGLAPARAIADVARASGLNVSIGSMMEGERGVRAAALLASAIAPEVTHDLDAAWWHRDGSLKYSKGELAL